MTAGELSIALNLCAFGSIIILLILSAFTVSLKEKINFYFFLNLVLIFMNFISEMIVDMLIGHAGTSINILIRIFDCIGFMIAGFQLIIITLYLYEYLKLKTVTSKKPFTVMVIIGIGIVLMAVIAAFTQLYVTLDTNNNYIRQPLYWLTQALISIALLIWIIIIIKHNKSMRVSEFLSLLLYPLAPIICYIAEISIPDFYITLLGAAVTISLIYINIQVQLKYQFEQREKELTEKRIAIMFSQIQPHFLYNSLTAIEDLCDTDIEKTKTAINDFAHYLRGNLESIGQNKLIPFEDELEHIETYLTLEKLRFGDKLNIVYDIKSVNFCVPPLTVQPIVENAVRHGINKKTNGGTVTIKSCETDTAFCIYVDDDGVGFDVTAPKNDKRIHVGIENVKGRISAQSGGTVEINSELMVGTKAVITIPKKKS